MGRVKARRIAFEMIFEYGFGMHKAEDIIALRRGEDTDLDDHSVAMLIACENRKNEIDELIENNSVGWTVQRMSFVTVAVLRLAVCELLAADDIPTAVTVNEAVELAKSFEGVECSSFVNGVLGSLVKELPAKAADAKKEEAMAEVVAEKTEEKAE